MRAVTLTSPLSGKAVVIDAGKVSWIRDVGNERIVFLDGENIVAVRETSGEILQRIYAAEGSQPGLFYPAVVIFAFVAGLVLGTIF